jgi:hypothetical protein
MDNTFSQIEPLLEKVEEYGKTSLELYTLKIIHKTTDMVCWMVSNIVVLVLLSMFFVFASFALAFWLGNLMDKTYWGFLTVAIFYLILVFVAYFGFNKYLTQKIRKLIIMKIFNSAYGQNK